MSYTILGTCSICGGEVTVPTVWWGIVAPSPSCRSCGAVARNHGPVIDMEPRHWELRTGTTAVLSKNPATTTNTTELDCPGYVKCGHCPINNGCYLQCGNPDDMQFVPKCPCVNGCKSAECDKL